MASCRLIVSLVLVLLFAQHSPTDGFKQELWLLFKENATTTNGNHLYFDSNEPDMSLYAIILPSVKRYCTRGVWETFSRLNFSNRHEELGVESKSGIFCKSFDAQRIRSLRYFVAHDTSIDAIALFPERG